MKLWTITIYAFFAFFFLLLAIITSPIFLIPAIAIALVMAMRTDIAEDRFNRTGKIDDYR